MVDPFFRFAQAFMGLSVAITAAELARETASDYLFTLIALILLGAAAPYLAGMTAMKRLSARWSRAIGIALCLFGAVDVTWRMQAFFFPTGGSDGAMALWLPIGGMGAIPLTAVIAHTFL